MSETTAENGGNEPLDKMILYGAILMPLAFGPLVLFAIGEVLKAGLVSSSAWLVLLFYEGDLVPWRSMR